MFFVSWPQHNQVWNFKLTALFKSSQHKRIAQMSGKNLLQAPRRPPWRCNYIGVSIRSSTARCRKLDTSLSGAKLAFGCVMSELLDSSSAGMLHWLFFPSPSTCQLPYRCCGVRRGLSPHGASAKPCSSPPGSLSPAYTSSLCCLFISHFLLIFSGCVCAWGRFSLSKAKRASRWPTCAGLWLPAADLQSPSLSALDNFLLFFLLHPSCLLCSTTLFPLAVVVRLSSL